GGRCRGARRASGARVRRPWCHVKTAGHRRVRRHRVAAARRCGARRSFVPDEVAPSETTNGRRTIGCWNVRLLTHVRYPANISADSRWHTVRINSPSLLVPPEEGDAREPVASPHPRAAWEPHTLLISSICPW